MYFVNSQMEPLFNHTRSKNNYLPQRKNKRLVYCLNFDSKFHNKIVNITMPSKLNKIRYEAGVVKITGVDDSGKYYTNLMVKRER